MQEDSSNNNAAASPVEVWDGWAQGSEPRGEVQANGCFSERQKRSTESKYLAFETNQN